MDKQSESFHSLCRTELFAPNKLYTKSCLWHPWITQTGAPTHSFLAAASWRCERQHQQLQLSKHILVSYQTHSDDMYPSPPPPARFDKCECAIKLLCTFTLILPLLCYVRTQSKVTYQSSQPSRATMILPYQGKKEMLSIHRTCSEITYCPMARVIKRPHIHRIMLSTGMGCSWLHTNEMAMKQKASYM